MHQSKLIGCRQKYATVSTNNFCIFNQRKYLLEHFSNRQCWIIFWFWSLFRARHPFFCFIIAHSETKKATFTHNECQSLCFCTNTSFFFLIIFLFCSLFFGRIKRFVQYLFFSFFSAFNDVLAIVNRLRAAVWFLHMHRVLTSAKHNQTRFLLFKQISAWKSGENMVKTEAEMH